MIRSIFRNNLIKNNFNSIKSIKNYRFLNLNTNYYSSNQRNNNNSNEMEDKTSLLITLNDRPGALHEILRFFWKYDVNLTHIESRPKHGNLFEFSVDIEGNENNENVQKVIDVIKKHSDNILILGEKEVVWYPRQISELDYIANRTLDAGAELQSDHPGFTDQEYRARRMKLAEVADNYVMGTPIPYIDYNENEINTWGAVYDKMEVLLKKFACKEYLDIFPLLEKHCGYSRDNIPQQENISQFLESRTGFRLRPVSGLLSSRDFLNGLAFRIFFSTQYIRHHSTPLYTPEPDICHELLGHAPMFADPEFADFSQQIGLASLGASDEDVLKLATCYWFSVEFGICLEEGKKKAYGAGLLSSFGELEYSCADYRPAGDTMDMAEYKEWDPNVACYQKYPITTYQPVYFVAPSLADAKLKMKRFCEDLNKPFHARYNPLNQTIWVDRAVKTKNHPFENN